MVDPQPEDAEQDRSVTVVPWESLVPDETIEGFYPVLL